MMYRCFGLRAAALVVISLAGADPATAGPLVMKNIQTASFPCDSTPRSMTWTNTYGMPIFIKGSRLQYRASTTLQADILVTVSRLSDLAMIHSKTWENLPTSTDSGRAPTDSITFAPDYMQVAAGDSVLLWHMCNFRGGAQGNFNAEAQFWFTVLNP